MGHAETDIDASDEQLEGEAHDEMDDIELLEYFDTELFEVPPGDDVETEATESFDIAFTLTAVIHATNDSDESIGNVSLKPGTSTSVEHTFEVRRTGPYTITVGKVRLDSFRVYRSRSDPSDPRVDAGLEGELAGEGN